MISRLSVILLFSAVGGCRTDLKDYWYKESFKYTYTVVDRAALPEMRSFVIDDEHFQTFIESDPIDDTINLGTVVNEKIGELRATVEAIAGFENGSEAARTPAEATRLLMPDVISVDFSQTLDFSDFNGRLHGDRATDILINLIFGRENLNDGFIEPHTGLDEFPYLERPNNK